MIASSDAGWLLAHGRTSIALANPCVLGESVPRSSSAILGATSKPWRGEIRFGGTEPLATVELRVGDPVVVVTSWIRRASSTDRAIVPWPGAIPA